MRLSVAGALLLALAFPAAARADYVVLRSGQRLSVTGYERRDEVVRVYLSGGFADIPADQILAIEPEEVFQAAKQAPPDQRLYREIIESASKKFRVDAELIASVIAVESSFDPRAVSRRNARGLMQLLPETAQRFGVTNIFDPRENIEAGTRYLKELLQRYDNNLALALAAYNAGPENVQKFGQVPPFQETRTYVQRVKRDYERKKSPGNRPLGGNSSATPKRRRVLGREDTGARSRVSKRANQFRGF